MTNYKIFFPINTPERAEMVVNIEKAKVNFTTVKEDIRNRADVMKTSTWTTVLALFYAAGHTPESLINYDMSIDSDEYIVKGKDGKVFNDDNVPGLSKVLKSEFADINGYLEDNRSRFEEAKEQCVKAWRVLYAEMVYAGIFKTMEEAENTELTIRNNVAVTEQDQQSNMHEKLAKLFGGLK